MPFVNISLARGKSQEYLEAVSVAVHEAMVAALGTKPDDNFQLITQHDQGEMVFNRTFRGSQWSDDWIVFAISEGTTGRQLAKRRFYEELVELLRAQAGVRPGDVFVMFSVTPISNFSFGDGVSGLDISAIEAFEADEKNPDRRRSYQSYEINCALRRLFSLVTAIKGRSARCCVTTSCSETLPRFPMAVNFTVARPSTSSLLGAFRAEPRCGSHSKSMSSRSSRPMATSSSSWPTMQCPSRPARP